MNVLDLTSSGDSVSKPPIDASGTSICVFSGEIGTPNTFEPWPPPQVDNSESGGPTTGASSTFEHCTSEPVQASLYARVSSHYHQRRVQDLRQPAIHWKRTGLYRASRLLSVSQGQPVVISPMEMIQVHALHRKWKQKPFVLFLWGLNSMGTI